MRYQASFYQGCWGGDGWRENISPPHIREQGDRWSVSRDRVLMISHQSRGKIHAHEHAWRAPEARITYEPIMKLYLRNTPSVSLSFSLSRGLDLAWHAPIMEIPENNSSQGSCVSGNGGSWGFSDPKYHELQIGYSRHTTWLSAAARLQKYFRNWSWLVHF